MRPYCSPSRRVPSPPCSPGRQRSSEALVWQPRLSRREAGPPKCLSPYHHAGPEAVDDCGLEGAPAVAVEETTASAGRCTPKALPMLIECLLVLGNKAGGDGQLSVDTRLHLDELEVAQELRVPLAGPQHLPQDGFHAAPTQRRQSGLPRLLDQEVGDHHHQPVSEPPQVRQVVGPRDARWIHGPNETPKTMHATQSARVVRGR